MNDSRHQFKYPAASNQFLVQHVSLLNRSFQNCMGYPLPVSSKQPEKMAQQLFHAPFVLLSHGTQADPIFNYANLTALKLFEIDWETLIQMPSKYSAESPNREERAQLLYQVETHGFIKNYSGVRIAKSGRRFRIDQAIVWNVIDQDGDYQGQAAFFEDWHFLK